MNNRGITCPLCNDTNISFHSDLRVQINKSHEEVAIFVCSASHTFLVSRRSLDHAMSKAEKEYCERSSHHVARLHAAHRNLVGIREKHRALRVKLQDFCARTQRTCSLLTMNRIITQRMITDSIAARKARLNARPRPAPSQRQKGQHVIVGSTLVQ
jgi:hypothetical protein